MAFQFYHTRPTPALDTLPAELRLQIYGEVVHDACPILTTHYDVPPQLKDLSALRRSSKLFNKDLNMLELADLKTMFYQENTFLFGSSEDLEDFVDHMAPNILENVRSIEIGGYKPEIRRGLRRRAIRIALPVLPKLPLLTHIRLSAGPFDWSINPEFDMKAWLQQPEDQRREPYKYLKAFLKSYSVPTIPNRAWLELIVRSHATDFDDQAYVGDHGDVKLIYRESMANKKDWKRIGEPIEYARQQAAPKLLTWA